MKIKKLEISGFKSFADAVAIDFSQDISAVVGPNGCGKSNIVDAIRWCLGEQSAKHLRGKAMEDVIFAGSETRKPLGMAEVTLTFSTEDGRAPSKYLDYAEIQLTRRLYRDGESDYLINKVPCRLLDITELFMDTGVGTRAYSIIEQGKIGQILHSRPEERRFLIEEAAGVTKFKSRKQLAIKKMDATKQNLSRLTDLLGEIKRNLSSLQRQAKKAEKFREYRDELRELELLAMIAEYTTLQERQATALQDGRLATDKRIEQENSIVALQNSEERGRFLLAEGDSRLQAAQEEMYRLKSEFATKESALQFHQRELASLTAAILKLSDESAELNHSRDELKQQRELLLLRKSSSIVDTSDLESRLSAMEKGVEEEEAGAATVSTAMEKGRRELLDILSDTARLKTKDEGAAKRINQITEQIARQQRENEDFQKRGASANARKTELATRLDEHKMEEEKLRSLLAALKTELPEIKRKRDEAENRWHAAKDEHTRKNSRLQSLKELDAQFAYSGVGVKNLMKSPEFKHLFTKSLADSIETAPEYEVAVESALAHILDAPVAANRDDAMNAVAYLAKNNLGRVSVISSDPPSLIAADINGAVSLASVVTVTNPNSSTIIRLLSSIFISDSAKQALSIAAERPDLTFVTLSGELVTCGSVLTGGGSDKLKTGVIHAKREIRELESAVKELEKRLEESTKERTEIRNSLENCSRDIRDKEQALHRAELAKTSASKDMENAAQELKRINERLNLHALENANLQQEQKELEEERGAIRSKLADYSTLQKSLEEQSAALKTERYAKQQQLAALRDAATKIKITLAEQKEQQLSNQRGVETADANMAKTEARLTVIASELAAARQGGTESETKLNELTEEIKNRIPLQLAAEEAVANARLSYEELQKSFAGIEAELSAARLEKERWIKKENEAELAKSTAILQIQNSEKLLAEKHRLSFAEALQRTDKLEIDQVRQSERKSELQKLLDDIGEVNLLAIDEYKENEERFNFLSSQKDDLEESMKSLQQAISRINRTTRQRFQETFDQVNERFKEVFPRLFCGGKAELLLTNEEDLLESGIDIVVQPPGKKLQNVTLLSGGEKALTAVALIFSIFQIKPTPFCLLDEVDAPLDDANIGRFNEMVREMSSISQFIIITHNKSTMKVAETLYGITMEEPGASKVVSVRLH